MSWELPDGFERIIMRFSGNFYLPEHDGFKADLRGIARLHGQG